MKKIGLSLLASALLAACASQQPAPVVQPAQPAQPAAAASTIAAPSAPVAAAPGAYNKLTDPNNILSQRAVYFDFDKYNVKDEFAELVQAHANYLTLTAGANSSLQGHADERGTAEYNLALGQKRADAVKKQMVSAYGVDAKQVETISYGKERPAVDGHNEAAWAKNRRVEIVYPGEAKFPKK
ncbi:MAG: peptidoglycan-associated lipoprotein [Proteobacteria bacterium]|nr:peptidoglycan-associated lipoprotein [Pseudomonadota bacterium]